MVRPMIITIQKIKSDLAWRTPVTNKPQRHVVIPREQASLLVREVECLCSCLLAVIAVARTAEGLTQQPVFEIQKGDNDDVSIDAPKAGEPAATNGMGKPRKSTLVNLFRQRIGWRVWRNL
jgi:hypothetical protein